MKCPAEVSTEFVRRTLQSQTVSLERFTGRILANAWDAGCAQINATHAQMMIWKDSLTVARIS